MWWHPPGCGDCVWVSAVDGPETQGVAIQKILGGSPAGEAGLKAGDVLSTIDGRWITSIADVYHAAAKVTPGREVTVGDQAGRQGAHTHDQTGRRHMSDSNTSALRRRSERVLVIGAGVSGLTSALCLRRRGFAVTVVAESFAPRVTSVVAGALWEWPPAVCGYHRDVDSLARSKVWCRTSLPDLRRSRARPPRRASSSGP